MNQLLIVIGGIISCVIGLWKYFGRKAQYRREQAEQARKDLDDAKKNDDSSSFLDAFGRMR